jgi:LmbE family N-acetylglucosaminyl deacetylase
VLHATVPRDTICRAVALAGKVYRFPATFDPTTFERAFSPQSEITHRVNVIRYASAKRASMRAHASQATADRGADRTLAAFLRLPRPLYDLIFGREWFVDPAHPPGAPVARDVFAGLP